MFWFLFYFFLFATNTLASDPIVKITNFSSNSSPEWVEIQNQGSEDVTITAWTIRDGNSSQTDDLTLTGCLSPGKYLTIYKESAWLNNDGDTISLYNDSSQLVDQLVYTDGKLDTNPRSDNVCTTVPTATSTPSSTPVPTATSAPLPTLTPSPTTVPTATRTPTPVNSPTNTPTRTPTPSPSVTSTRTPTPTLSFIPTVTPEGLPTREPTPTSIDLPLPTLTPTPVPTIYADTSNQSFSIGSYLPSFFIISGSLLLISPLIISKLKKH